MSLPLIQPSLDSAIYLHKLTLDLRYKLLGFKTLYHDFLKFQLETYRAIL